MIVKRCLDIRFPRPSEPGDSLTIDYYDETIVSIKYSEKRTELIGILLEFAHEVRNDAALKLLAFQRLDIFILLQAACRRTLFETEAGAQNSFINGDLLWSSCLDQIIDRGGRAGMEDARTVQLSREKASTELLERFQVYEASLNV